MVNVFRCFYICLQSYDYFLKPPNFGVRKQAIFSKNAFSKFTLRKSIVFGAHKFSFLLPKSWFLTTSLLCDALLTLTLTVRFSAPLFFPPVKEQKSKEMLIIYFYIYILYININFLFHPFSLNSRVAEFWTVSVSVSGFAPRPRKKSSQKVVSQILFVTLPCR